MKHVPESIRDWEQMMDAANAVAEAQSKAWPLDPEKLESLARKLLERLDYPDRYLGFAMVLIGNSFWREQLLGTPFHRRLLLMPSDLKPSAIEGFSRSEDNWPATLHRWQCRAKELGYQVLHADRSMTVLTSLVEGPVDAIIGVADMNVLERAIDNVLLAGVPSYVIPLSSQRHTRFDEIMQSVVNGEWLGSVLERYVPYSGARTRSYVPLFRAANGLFGRGFERLLPRRRSCGAPCDEAPLSRTEAVAYDWLANGGKRFRPFITLAAYEALTNREPIAGDGESGESPAIPDAVCRVAMAIEAFHKASLVHDDIQDDDQFRYGRETLHRTQGIGPAINIGDYLIGLGYRLVNSCQQELGADVAADIVNSMSDAHLKLCDGQGAEMAWLVAPDWTMTPDDALQIYELKTSPAFEAALYAGLRMAGPLEAYSEVIPEFARQIGIGFQVLNDLKDWHGDADNKLVVGQDALAIRPTVLLALALESASEAQRTELKGIYESEDNNDVRFTRLRDLFKELGAFDAAFRLVNQSREQALSLAAAVQPGELQRLLVFLVDTVLAGAERAGPSMTASTQVASANGNGSGSSRNGKTRSGRPGSKSLR